MNTRANSKVGKAAGGKRFGGAALRLALGILGEEVDRNVEAAVANGDEKAAKRARRALAMAAGASDGVRAAVEGNDGRA